MLIGLGGIFISVDNMKGGRIKCPHSVSILNQPTKMKFATINFCIAGKNMSRCHHTCSVNATFGNAIQRLIDNNNHNSFTLSDGTILQNVVICDWTDQPVATQNHHGFLSRLLGIIL